ncbi:MAG: hypothetical protein JRJ85_05475, partial [Deltaproteobacteria bacterium]|nr:hypothetical protein [Deltaproteobacteria bacterium]
MFLKKIRVFIVLPVLLVLLFASLILLANALVQRPSIQKYFIKRVTETTGFYIQTRTIELNLWRGIGLFVNGLEASSEALKMSLTAKKVRIILDMGHLIRGRFVPVKIFLDQPELTLTPAFWKQPADPKTEEKAASLPFWMPGLDSLSLYGGQVHLKNRPFKLMGITMDIRPQGRDPGILVVNATGDMHFRGKKSFFRTRTRLSQLSDADRSPYIDMTMDTDDIPLEWIPWPSAIEMKKGNMKATLNVHGNINDALNLKGHVLTRSTRFSLLNDRERKDYILPELRLDFHSLIKKDRIRVPSLLIKIPGVSLNLKMTLDITQRHNPYLDLQVKSAAMTFDTFEALFPYPVLPAWIENILLPLFSEADIQIHRLLFRGRMKQFENIHLPRNRSVLSMDLSCKNFEMNHAAMIGPLRGRRARVTLDKGDLTISGLTATFGGSAIKEAGLRIKAVYENNPLIETSVSGSFVIQDLIKQMRADLMPGDVRDHLDTLGSLNGSMTCNARILYRPDWEWPVIESGRFVFRDCTLREERLVYPIHINIAEVLFRHKDRPRFTGDGRWGRSPFNIKGIFTYGGKGVQFER